jgi:FkbM family methyltransferase
MADEKRIADVVISVAAIKDLGTWKLTAEQLPRRIASKDYWLIVPDDQVDVFRASTPDVINIFPESFFTFEFEGKLNDCQGKALPARRGWYLQQLIKLAALRTARNFERVIIWDADTVPLREINFFSEIGTCRYYSGTDYHLQYFENIDRLLGLDKARPESFITQNFPILGSQIKAFFEYIERRHSTNWWEAVIESINFDEMSGFSEYEVLGTFTSFSEDKGEKQSGIWSYGVARQISHQLKKSSLLRAPKFDFLAVEEWAQPKFGHLVIDESINKIWRAVIRLAAQIRLLSPRILKSQITLETELQRIFSLENKLQVVQIGANDGIQNDPLRKYLQSPGNYTAKLVEPIPFYFNQLSTLYTGRADVEIVNLAVGSRSGELQLFHIDPRVAYKMNGDGPQNNWALGQGSNSRATVVYWIYKNAWRGIDYMERIPEWLEAIEMLPVPIIPTGDLIGNGDRTLLVIDVQGMEGDVILGLAVNNLPKWVVIEEDLGRESARNLLLSWGYKEVVAGSDSMFELNDKH